MSTDPAAQPAAPAPRRRISPWWWVLAAGGCLTALGPMLIAAVVVIGIINVAGHREGGPGPSPEPVGVTTPGDVPQGQPYIQYGDGAPDDTVVDVYLDFLCPYCQQFSAVNAADLEALATREDVTVRVHPRPMLDAMTTPAGYSGRAANAALCVYDEDPATYWAMERSLFEAQPAEGGAGLDDDRLIEIAHGAGASDAVDACITEQRFVPYLETTVEPDASGKGYGTPVVEIDGVQLDADVTQPGVLRQAVEAA